MVQHAVAKHEVERAAAKGGVAHIALNDVGAHRPVEVGLAGGNRLRRAVDRNDFRTVAGREKRMPTKATPGIQHQLAREVVRNERTRNIEEISFELRNRPCELRPSVAGSGAGLAVRGHHAGNAVCNRILRRAGTTLQRAFKDLFHPPLMAPGHGFPGFPMAYIRRPALDRAGGAGSHWAVTDSPEARVTRPK